MEGGTIRAAPPSAEKQLRDLDSFIGSCFEFAGVEEGNTNTHEVAERPEAGGDDFETGFSSSDEGDVDVEFLMSVFMDADDERVQRGSDTP